jgi:hypothetical protein
MKARWKVVAAIGALATALTVGGIAGAQLSRQDFDAIANLNNGTCPTAFDLSTTALRAHSTTQNYSHTTSLPQSFGPNVYFLVPVVPNGQQLIVDVQAQWRPSLGLSLSCNGNDIGAAVESAPGGSTVAWTNTTGSAQSVRVVLAGNRVVDFGQYLIEAVVGNNLDETGIAVEAAAEHVLPRRDTWTFVEGTTRTGFVTFLTLLSEDQQTIVLEYFDERGPQPPQTCVLPAHTRVTLRENSNPVANPNGNICADGFYGDGPGHDVSVRIIGTDELRAERVVYHVSGVVGGSSASSASTGDHD